MVDQIKRYLLKLSSKERILCESIIGDILAGNIVSYDLKKMSGYTDMYRIKKGNMWIIFIKNNSFVRILKIANRDEQTYRGF